MRVPLVINGRLHEGEIEYVVRRDASFLHDWKRSVAGDSHPIRLDAVNFATLACKRYAAHAALENYATRQEDVADYIKDNPFAEVANFVLLRCRWFPGV